MAIETHSPPLRGTKQSLFPMQYILVQDLKTNLKTLTYIIHFLNPSSNLYLQNMFDLGSESYLKHG